MNAAVRGALAEARALGFLGPGPLESHDESAQAFITALGTLEGHALDLGSGGGVPGLLLADHFSTVDWVLLDVNRRRTSFLARAVASLGWTARVTVVRAAAEAAAHELQYRFGFETVVARSFARPAITAECSSGFLALGGRLAVSEPPAEQQADRWNDAGLRSLGLASTASPLSSIALFEKIDHPGDEVPRSWKALERNPLW